MITILNKVYYIYSSIIFKLMFMIYLESVILNIIAILLYCLQLNNNLFY